MAKTGGFGTPKEVTEDVAALVVGLKPAIEEAAESKYEEFKPLVYSSQVVAGTNYKVKVKVGDSAYIHVAFFRPLPHTGNPVELKDVETGKTATDAL